MQNHARSLHRRPGGLALVVTLGVAVLAACTTPSDDLTSPGPTDVPPTEPTTTVPDPNNSADRLIIWTGPSDLVNITDDELSEWKRRGVDGFVLVVQHLRGLGGKQDFTGDPSADLRAANYETQRSLKDSSIGARAKALGMKIYLGFYLVNLLNTVTPLVDWFDDAGWSNTVLPRIREMAAAAHQLNYAGLAFDQELYPQVGNVLTATWSWGYHGNRRSEQETRAKVAARGQQVMETMVREFPGVELTTYASQLPESWEELVQKEVNNIDSSFASGTQIDFLDGLSRVRGYTAIHLFDPIFYKTTHVRGSNWTTANQYNTNRVYALLSRRLSDWSYAASRVHLTPFGWIDNGPAAFEAARSPEYVAEQLAAFRLWGAGREFGVYTYRGLKDFDWRPYIPAMQAASRPGRVDTEPPALGALQTPSTTTSPTVELKGTATDNLAVRSVRWQVGDRTGAATMTWQVLSGDARSGYTWQMNWSTGPIPVSKGPNQIVITVEDIKGLTTVATLETVAS